MHVVPGSRLWLCPRFIALEKQAKTGPDPCFKGTTEKENKFYGDGYSGHQSSNDGTITF